MNIKRPKNTKEKGVIEFLVYKNGKSFVGVCLTFDIVEAGNDPQILMKSISEAAELHLETVRKLGWSDELLNRYAPEEYWKKYFETAKKIENPSLVTTDSLVVSPYHSSLIAQLA